VNRKQRRAEGKTGKDTVSRSSDFLVETLFRQAIGHHQAGHFREAEAGYREVLAANPRHGGALGYLGLLAHQSGHSDAGIDLLRKAIAADRRNPEPHYNLARVLSDRGRDDEAIVHNRKVLELAPDFPGAHNNLAALLLLHGRPAEALTVAIRGLRLEDSASLKSTFVMAVRSLDPAAIQIDQDFIALLVRALTEPWCRPRDLSAAAGAILLRRPSMARCVARIAQGGATRLNELFDAAELAALTREGLLDALLSTSPVATVEAERILTAMRHALLDEVDAGAMEATDAWLPLASAIGQQGFLNEYVFDVSDRENTQALKLRDAVDASLARGEAASPIQVAVLAAYLPLHALAKAEHLASLDGSEPLRALITQQIVNHRDEQAIRPAIERLTAIEDDVSEKVRQQYEENPYPRWSRLFAESQPLPVDHYIRMRFPGTPYKAIGSTAPEVLIAGCGTGMHAIQRALQFRPANVLAIDLSLSSLSYAIRKTKELGLTNLRYAQADILALDGERTFDVVDSSGVLHHLKNPLDGWRTLAGLVRPGGLMHIGLYSATARRDINAARAYLAQQKRDYSIEDVRHLRADIVARPPGDPLHNITQFSDFFSMSECRDLLFHVQEHQFTIPRIAAFLEESGFTFLGFETPARASYLRRFPDDKAATNLANWAVFETENPATFAQMYQFWIQKI
jgi:2-polyprenyl-3-methyl-5-hydroxy-6-metoxy-1,4-benzoquinol methylase